VNVFVERPLLIVADKLFCKIITANGIIYSNVRFTSNSSLNCYVHYPHVENTKLLLWINESQNGFDYSNNYEDLIVVNETLNFNVSKMMHLDSFSNSISINFTIPSTSKFKYQLKIGDNQRNVSCSYTNVNPICLFPMDYLSQIELIPSYIESILVVTHSFLNDSISIPITSFIYYEDLEIKKIFPFLISHFEQLNNNISIFLNFTKILNYQQFNFKVNISQNSKNLVTDLRSEEKYLSSHKFHSFGVPDVNYIVSLLFSKGNEDLVEITKNLVKIQSVSYLTYLNQIGGSMMGNSTISVNIPTFPTNSIYDFSFKLIGKLIWTLECDTFNGSFRCKTPNVSDHYLFENMIKMKLQLFINNVKSLDLLPYYKFYSFYFFYN
jgi:hypothetical protein